VSGYLLSLYCETNTHAGAEESVGTVDLPIQRNSVTGHPEFQESTVKGAIKRHVASVDANLAKRAFGGDPKGTDEPGVVHPAGAHVFLLPLPTGQDTFWWFTSPFSVAKTARLAAAIDVPAPPMVVPRGGDGVSAKAIEGLIVHDVVVDLREDAQLPELATYCAQLVPAVREYDYFRARLTARQPTFAVLRDDVFSLLCTTSRVVQARNQLGERKRSENVWYTEFLPSETVMVSKLSGPPGVTEDVVAVLRDRPLFQLGGLEGLGAGRMRATVFAQPLEAREGAA
jgi:CRISPR-associated protein Cmr4